jgi:DNA-binding protein HU-beta
MTKSEVVQILASRHALTLAQANSIINDLSDLLIQDIETNGEAVVHGIGKIKLVERAARLGRNPKDGTVINIPATKSLKFLTTKALKERINEA